MNEVVLTERQAEFVRLVNERFGEPATITRKQILQLKDEGIISDLNCAFWIQGPRFKSGWGEYKVPNLQEVTIVPNKKRGRPRKNDNSKASDVAPTVPIASKTDANVGKVVMVQKRETTKVKKTPTKSTTTTSAAV